MIMVKIFIRNTTLENAILQQDNNKKKRYNKNIDIMID